MYEYRRIFPSKCADKHWIAIIKVFIYQLMHKRIALKKNIKIYVKTVPTCFGAITIIRDSLIRAC